VGGRRKEKGSVERRLKTREGAVVGRRRESECVKERGSN